MNDKKNFFCRCRKWIINCRRADLEKYTPEQLYKNYQLCAEHFEDNQFSNSQTKKRLIPSAYPTLFDIKNPLPTLTLKQKLPNRETKAVTVSESDQEELESDTPEPDTPRKAKLKKKNATLCVKLHHEKRKKSGPKNMRLKTALSCLKQHLPHDQFAFIESQVVKSSKSKKAYR